MNRAPESYLSAFISPGPCREHDESQSTNEYLEAVLRAHGLAGVSIAVLDQNTVTTMCSGSAHKELSVPMKPSTWLQQASLSKTLGAAYMVGYYQSRGVPLSTPVIEVLKRLRSPFKLEPGPGCPESWVHELTLAHLVNHTALGMHYVFGAPPSRSEGFPTALDFIEGREQALGYNRLLVEKQPGSKFAYSGGGFILLQHILELEHSAPIHQVMEPWLRACGVTGDDFGFLQVHPGAGASNPVEIATGYLDDGSMVKDGRLMFPPLAAGGHSTPRGLLTVLYHIARAYHLPPGKKSGAITREAARAMLDSPVDRGCMDFMQSLMGLGVFVITAGPNKFMLHQAANDGFRGVYLVCFDGPDAMRGFVLNANGDNKAMFMNCELCKALLKRLQFQGMDWSKVDSAQFSTEGVSQEQIVNLGYKELVLKAFLPATSSKL